jgi:hypothetical protein
MQIHAPNLYILKSIQICSTFINSQYRSTMTLYENGIEEPSVAGNYSSASAYNGDEEMTEHARNDAYSDQGSDSAYCNGASLVTKTESAYLKISKSEDEETTSSSDTDDTDQSSSRKSKPSYSYIALISIAIQSFPEKKMLLSEIYQWITETFQYYTMKDRSWRNSIRHNLSLNECFIKSGRSENGKGNYWSIHPANMEDFSRGDFRRRRARRRVRKCDEDLRSLVSPYPTHSGEFLESVPHYNVTAYNKAYVPMMSTYASTSYLTSEFGVEPILSTQERLERGIHVHAVHRDGYSDMQESSSDIQYEENTSVYVPGTVSPAHGTFPIEAELSIDVSTGARHFRSQTTRTHFSTIPSWQDTFFRKQTGLGGTA